MTTATTPPAPPAPAANTIESRDPDRILRVIRWIDDAPRRTGMTTSEGHPKFQRDAVVLNAKGGEVTVPVVGSERQFEAASGSQVEAYYGHKSEAWYFQPAITNASVKGDPDLF